MKRFAHLRNVLLIVIATLPAVVAGLAVAEADEGGAETRARVYARIEALFWQGEGESRLGSSRSDLRSLASFDLHLAARVLEYPWVLDGIGVSEHEVLRDLSHLAPRHPQLVRELLDAWWLQDGVDTARQRAVDYLFWLVRSDAESARTVLREPFMQPPFRDIDTYTLQVLQSASPERRAELLSRGITDEDAALIHAMYSGVIPRGLGEGFVDSVTVASRTVVSPLRGQVHLFLVEELPETNKDETFAILEQGIRWLEEYVGEPFPSDSVVAILVKRPEWNVSGRLATDTGSGPEAEVYFPRHLMLLASHSRGPRPSDIYHELTHYYRLQGPGWIKEGSANFFEAYALARASGRPLSDRLAALDASAESCPPDIYSYLEKRGPSGCHYVLGERLLLDLHEHFGSAVVGGAVKEAFALSRVGEFLDEDATYDALLAGVPPARLDEFNDIYRRRHGGPQADGDPAGGAERRALTALFEAAGGTSWLYDRKWLSDSRVGAWHGVATYNDGRVAHVSLDRNGLNGSIPPELAELEEVNTIELSANSLTGPIPPALGTLTMLTSLTICCNELSGTIPEELGDLDRLWTLRLSANRLSGAIPPGLGRLGALQDLSLQQNSLAGTIPDELGHLRELRSLQLSRNLLEGAIPTSLAGLGKVEFLDLSGNRLTGPIPPELGRLPNLEYLLLHDNQLSGCIPSSLGAIDGLLGLYLAGNDLVGCIPVGLRDVPDNDFDELGLPFCPEPVPVVSPGAEVALEPGWTLVRWEGTDHVSVGEATREIRGPGSATRLDALVAVYAWDAATLQWLTYYAHPEIPGLPGLNTLATLRTGHEYWVAVAEPATWTAPAP